MAESIIAFIAERLNIPTGETEANVRRFAQALRSQAAESGEASVPGLGTFTHTETGLEFTPDDALLKAAWASVDSLETLEIVSHKNIPTTPIPGVPTPAREEPTPEESEDKGEPTPPVPPTSQSTRRGLLSGLALGTGLSLTAAVALVLLWWFLPNSGIPNLLPLGESADTVYVVDTVLAEVVRVDTIYSRPPAAEPVTPDPPPTPPERGFDRTVGGYTLIVASFQDFEVAEREVERFKQLTEALGLPVELLRSSDGLRYRVALGQVPTPEAAIALRDQHIDLLPRNAWALLIPDSQ